MLPHPIIPTPDGVAIVYRVGPRSESRTQTGSVQHGDNLKFQESTRVARIESASLVEVTPTSSTAYAVGLGVGRAIATPGYPGRFIAKTQGDIPANPFVDVEREVPSTSPRAQPESCEGIRAIRTCSCDGSIEETGVQSG